MGFGHAASTFPVIGNEVDEAEESDVKEAVKRHG